MTSQRVVLYMDAQNLYKGARDGFGVGHDPFTFGQIHPVELGKFNLFAASTWADATLGGDPHLYGSPRFFKATSRIWRKPCSVRGVGKGGGNCHSKNSTISVRLARF